MIERQKEIGKSDVACSAPTNIELQNSFLSASTNILKFVDNIMRIRFPQPSAKCEYSLQNTLTSTFPLLQSMHISSQNITRMRGLMFPILVIYAK
ncbi:hypothetical protein ACS0TY_026401 [Phlomoides rotata]